MPLVYERKANYAYYMANGFPFSRVTPTSTEKSPPQCMFGRLVLNLLKSRDQGRNEGGQGRRNSPGAEKSQQCHKYFFMTVHLLPKDLRFEHGGAKLASCAGRHLTSLRPCPCCICVFFVIA